jgi:hypothetical protein
MDCAGAWHEAPSAPARTGASAPDAQRLDDILGHLLGVAEQHHGVVAVEQGIVDAGIARGQRALDEHHGAGLPDLQHRHAVDRRFRIVLGRRVGDVVGADHEGDVGLGEFRIDVLEFEHLVIGHVGFGEQHVHVAGHAAGDRVNRVFDLDAFLLELSAISRSACCACATAMP